MLRISPGVVFFQNFFRTSKYTCLKCLWAKKRLLWEFNSFNHASHVNPFLFVEIFAYKRGAKYERLSLDTSRTFSIPCSHLKVALHS